MEHTLSFFRDLVQDTSSPALLRSVDVTGFLVQELSKIFPIIVDISNFFGFNLEVLTLHLQETLEYTYIQQVGFFNVKYYSFSLFNPVLAVDDFAFDGDTLKLGSWLVDNSGWEVPVVQVQSNCLEQLSDAVLKQARGYRYITYAVG